MTTKRARKPKPYRRKAKKGQKLLKPGWPEAFLASFAICGNVTEAAETANVKRQTVYDMLGKDEKFAQAYDDAEKQSADRLYAEARRRAVEGTKRPLVSGGRVICHVQEYSDTLLITLLRARDNRFHNKHEISGGGGPMQVIVSDATQAAALRPPEEVKP